MLKVQQLRYYVLILFLLLSPVMSCGPNYKSTRAQKQQERQADKRRLEGEKTLQGGQERHQEIQSRETRKRMKETRRQSHRLNNNRRIPFYERWYKAIFKKR